MCASPGGLNTDFVPTLYLIIDFIVRILTYCFFFIDGNLVKIKYLDFIGVCCKKYKTKHIFGVPVYYLYTYAEIIIL